MARRKNEVVVTEPTEMPEQAATLMMTAHNEAVEQYDRAVALAGELGYQGAVTVDALEGEIRFYQRRTVEAILETGKRLLVLKELTPHGEFYERVEALGFSTRTAQRFMQAATKATKSATVADLSTKMKSAKAFLELVTHDDDADLEHLAQLDDIDRMSASEVRQALREAKAERQATQQLLDEKNQVMDKLAAELQKAHRRRETVPPDEAAQALRTDVAATAHAAEHSIRQDMHMAIAALMAHSVAHGGDGKSLAAGCVMQVQQALNDLRDEFELPAFQDYVPNWLELKDGDAALPIDRASVQARGDVLLADIAVDPADFDDKE